jgi:hypothetical protein
MRPLIQPSVPSSAVATGIIKRHIRKKSGRPTLLHDEAVDQADDGSRCRADISNQRLGFGALQPLRSW